ncbi:hypothetical protein ACHAXR_005431 [Thalassiosira sp. AJA248-18]
MRVRLLIPSLLLEGEYYQEAYDFLRHSLQADTSLMIMDLALMGGHEEEEGAGAIEDNWCKFSSGENIVESPEVWMDSEMVYPSIGMVFELAFLKCHLLCSLRSGQFQKDLSNNGSYAAVVTLAEKCVSVGEDELERQVRLLLSVVHKLNPHLLPNLSESYDIEAGALSNKKTSVVVEEEGTTVPATPPALSSLLNKHPPGFELQYKMGNPGGGCIDEAVAIWQRDMMIWHTVDPTAMKFLSEFCSNLDDRNNLLDTSCLRGCVESKSGQSSSSNANVAETQNIMENVTKRKEAEELVAKLRREKPDRTMDEIMMHPEMAQLMIKHLHTE